MIITLMMFVIVTIQKHVNLFPPHLHHCHYCYATIIVAPIVATIIIIATTTIVATSNATIAIAITTTPQPMPIPPTNFTTYASPL